jgi:uncharacterized protein YqjF (DUF2071 family)
MLGYSEAVRTFSPLAPVSIARPIMRQTWCDLTFLHWPYSAEVIRKLIPRELSLDTFDGVAWVALAPFVLAGVRPFGLPATPWISEFPETNVRTYVLGPDGEPGVWFFTLEADRLLGVMAARAWYKLPYRWAAMSVRSSENTVEYRSERHRLFGKGASHVVIEVGSKVDTGDFDYFLTARFRLYTVHRSRVGYAEIDHPPWPLQHGRVTTLEEDLVMNSGVPKPEGEPVVHFSRRLDVKVAPLRWL